MILVDFSCVNKPPHSIEMAIFMFEIRKFCLTVKIENQSKTTKKKCKRKSEENQCWQSGNSLFYSFCRAIFSSLLSIGWKNRKVWAQTQFIYWIKVIMFMNIYGKFAIDNTTKWKKYTKRMRILFARSIDQRERVRKCFWMGILDIKLCWQCRAIFFWPRKHALCRNIFFWIFMCLLANGRETEKTWSAVGCFIFSFIFLFFFFFSLTFFVRFFSLFDGIFFFHFHSVWTLPLESTRFDIFMDRKMVPRK